MVYICTKLHENILNGSKVMERTRKVNGRTDGRPDRRTGRQTDGRTEATPKTVLGPGRVAQSVGHLTRKSEVLGSIPGLATYFRFSFR